MVNIQNKNEKIKVAVGLSGGVDSSVAAYLLQKEGYDVTGVYLQCWDEKADGCSAEVDRASAVSVAAHLDIPFKHLDFVKQYKDKVISYFYKEYKNGRTPNPDILCNTEIKFGMFLDWAIENGYDFVATGHYAQVFKEGEDVPFLHAQRSEAIAKGFEHAKKCTSSLLLKGRDEKKDQSYFLYRIGKEKFAKVLFPIGHLKKEEVRKLAKTIKLPTYNRPDSQGICFIGKVDIKDFLKKQLHEKKGKVLFKDGTEIGEHDGVWFYTIGQRHGFKVNRYFGLPLYVIGKNVENNELTVGFAKDVLQTEFKATDFNWLYKPEQQEFECQVRIRHLGKCHQAKVKLESEELAIVSMHSDTFGIASGQSAVFYDGDLVLGGGIIV